MRLTGDGKMGIGTSAPNAQLQLGNTSANRKLVLFEAANNDHQFYGMGINTNMMRYQVNATGADHVFYAGASSTTSNELMRLTGDGKMGIGTSTPNAPLQLGNTGGNRKIVLFDFENENNDHQFYGLGINSNVMRYQVDATASNHIFYAGASSTTSNELLRITGGGKIGIGTGNSTVTSMDINGGLTLRNGGIITVGYDNYTINVGDRTYLRIDADGGTAATRTVKLTNGLAIGQILIIEGLGSNSFEITSSDNIRLDAVNLNLDLNSNDTLMLIWNGSYWIEISRSNNENS